MMQVLYRLNNLTPEENKIVEGAGIIVEIYDNRV